MGGHSAGERSRSDVHEALPLSTRARVAVGALGLLIVADLIALGPDLELLSVTDRLLDGERVPFADLDSVDDRLRATGLAQLVLLIVSIVTFLLWYSRAYRNVIAMGIRKPRYGTRWAVISWFVPVVNLVIPKKASNDIYRGSDPEMSYGDADFASRQVTPLLHWWWALWLLSGLLNRAAAASGFDARDPRDFSDSAKLYIVADGIQIVAAVLAIAVILRITARSEERRRRFEINRRQTEGDTGGELPPPGPAWPAQPGQSDG